MEISATTTPQPPITFLRLLEEQHIEIFKKIFKETFSEDYRSVLIKRSKEKKDLKFRLIKKGEETLGIIVYLKKPSNAYSLLGWDYAMHVKALHVTPNFNRAVREVLIQTGREMHASTILVNVLKSNEKLKADLLARRFKKIEAAHSNFLDLFGFDGEKATEIKQNDFKPLTLEDDRPTIEIEDDRPEKKPKVDPDQ